VEDRERKGAENEHRFFNALSVRTDTTPDWFRRIKTLPAQMDVRGVDACAYIWSKGTTANATKVPIQIKSSYAGKRHYQQEQPVLQSENVVVVVILPDMTDDDIRRETYALLEGVHESGKRLGSFWKQLVKAHVSNKAWHKATAQRQLVNKRN
jgi:hypothetical protein